MMRSDDRPPRRFMLIGAVGAGKTTLFRALVGDEAPVRKTQTADYGEWLIDTPGEYAEIIGFRHRLVALANEAKLLLVVQDATRARSCFPPGYLLTFPRPALGIVSKTDLPEADADRAAAFLREAGVKGEIHPVSATLGSGMAALRQRLSSCLAGREGENEHGNSPR
jgi:ethanolamine utilization protein EutP